MAALQPAIAHQAAGTTASAGTFAFPGAEQGLGKGSGQGRLAQLGWPQEKIGVARPALGRLGQQIQCPAMTVDAPSLAQTGWLDKGAVTSVSGLEVMGTTILE